MSIPKTCSKAKNILPDVRLQRVHKILPGAKASIQRGTDFRR